MCILCKANVIAANIHWVIRECHSTDVAAVLTINQTYNNLGLYDSVADSKILLLNNQSIVQLEVHLLGIKVSHNILISSTQTLAAKTDFLCGRPQARPRGERG